MREFWRRWHISLIGWFTQYVYYPLGGSRCSRSRNIFNVLVVFTLSGLWHGASWTYVSWGFYNGLLFIPLILLPSQHYRDTVAHGRLLPTVRELFSMALTFVLFILGLIMFRAPDFQHIVDYSNRLFSLSFFSHQGMTMKMATTLMWCAGLTLVEWVQREKQHILQIDGYRVFKHSVTRLFLYAFMVFLIFYFAGQVQTFIYFQF
jgi:D-alanyl-lipoteichoic acid acyltransferase DltB (MBOAT superfamily)